MELSISRKTKEELFMHQQSNPKSEVVKNRSHTPRMLASSTDICPINVVSFMENWPYKHNKI